MSGNTHRRRRQDGRRTGEIRGSLLKAAAGAAALALGAFLLHAGWGWAQQSPRFAVRQVTFRGLERASEGELIKLSGLTYGQNLLSLDLAAATRAMAAHPWVKEVEARRRFPSTVEIQV